MKKLLTVSLAVLLIVAFCSNLDLSISKAQEENGGEGSSGSSRDVTPPDVYLTEAQLHARLFRYDGANFSNISGAFQNVSPETQSISWNGTDWMVSARGRFWEYNGTALTNITAVETAGSYPYYDVAWNGNYWLGGSLMGSVFEYDGVTANAYPLNPSVGADVMTADWNTTDGSWMLGVLGTDFYVHLINYPGAGGDNNDLGRISTDVNDGINGSFAGDYILSGETYYLAGGANVTMDEDGNITDSQSRIYIYDGNFSDLASLIPNLETKVTAITGGTSFGLIGGEGTKPLYKYANGAVVTALDTPAELTSVKSIGRATDTDWLIGGYYTNDAGTSAKLYSYDGTTFTDLTATMQGFVQSYISDINSITWNGTYWLIGGAGLYNVGPDIGGSVMSTDESAKIALPSGAVEHDSLVSINETTEISSDASLESAGLVYDFTCQDLVTNNPVTQLDKSATINLSYDETLLGDVSEDSLSLYYYDEASKKWISVSGGTIDTASKTITAEVDHFTKFGVFAAAELPQTGK